MPKQEERKKKSEKKTYKVRNWKEYNEALVNRGRILFHITEDAIKQWEEAERNKKRGRPKKFSDTAIETALTLSQIFRLPLRTTEGLLSDILKKLGAKCDAPDYTTLSVRSKTLSVSIRIRDIRENLHVVVDSTGVKVFGEGEWKVRKHGYSKHRTRLKLHLGADETTGDILAGEVTNNSVHDSAMLDPLLDQLENHVIDQCSADGAYDKRKCYQTLKEHGVKKVAIPTQKNAKIWQHGNSKEDRLVRDENLRAIRKSGRKQWKEDSDYHRRSLSETAMFRLKTVFGEKVSARSFVNQRVQLLLRLKTLNRMTALGMPESYVVA